MRVKRRWGRGRGRGVGGEEEEEEEEGGICVHEKKNVEEVC